MSAVSELEEIRNLEPKKATVNTIDSKLAALKKCLPSHIIKELGDTMKSMPLSEKQCDIIIEKTVSEFERKDRVNVSVNEINDRITGMEKSVSKLIDIMTKNQVNAQISAKKEDKILDEANIYEKSNFASNLVYKQKPMQRLVKIEDDIKSTMILLKWLEFLLEKVGREHLINTLEFYVDIGWINYNVFSQLMMYTKGINIAQYDSNGLYSSELTAKDHIQSLLFIEKLRGNEVDRQMISILEREVSSIKKGSEEIYGV